MSTGGETKFFKKNKKGEKRTLFDLKIFLFFDLAFEFERSGFRDSGSN
jgi:hypothetical protein